MKSYLFTMPCIYLLIYMYVYSIHRPIKIDMAYACVYMEMVFIANILFIYIVLCVGHCQNKWQTIILVPFSVQIFVTIKYTVENKCVCVDGGAFGINGKRGIASFSLYFSFLLITRTFYTLFYFAVFFYTFIFFLQKNGNKCCFIFLVL